MFRIFNFVKFLKWSTPDAHPDELSLEYSGIALRQFTHSLEIKWEIPFFSFGFARVTEVRHINIHNF